MNLEKLNARVELLKQEHVKANGHVAGLKEQLGKAEVNLNMIIGHLNEASFHLSEAQKESAPAEPEKEDGKVDEQPAE